MERFGDYDALASVITFSEISQFVTHPSPVRDPAAKRHATQWDDRGILELGEMS
jgi:hypothetical protein